jgi:hypothetical protein
MMTAPIENNPGEPAGVFGILAGLVAVMVALHWHMTAETGALWTTLFVAVGGLVTAVRTRPVAPAVITTVIAAAVALVGGYGFHAGPGLVAAISGLVLAVLNLAAVRPHVVPVGRVV